MPAKVLIVDDSNTVREEVLIALSGLGVEVQEAGDGFEALQVIQSESFDCVICDVNMPRMGGIELVAEIKADPEFAALPFLMLTTEGAKEAILEAKKAGACAWMVKPFENDMLARTVKKLTTATAISK